MLTFPSTLPRPVWGGHAMTPLDTREITPVEQGSPRIRRRSSLMPTTVQCRWRFSDDEFDVFRHFVDVGLQGATDSFTFGVRVGSAWYDEECIFASYPAYNPVSPGVWDVEATLVVKQRLALPLYRDIVFGDDGDTLILGTLTGSRSVWRAEIYVRTGVDAGTSSILRIGHATDADAYVTDISVAVAGRYVITDGAGYDGVLMGATEATTRVVQAQLVNVGTAATVGDLSVVLMWRP